MAKIIFVVTVLMKSCVVAVYTVYNIQYTQRQHQHTDCIYGHNTGLHKNCNGKSN